jgi:hypothetical protein
METLGKLVEKVTPACVYDKFKKTTPPIENDRVHRPHRHRQRRSVETDGASSLETDGGRGYYSDASPGVENSSTGLVAADKSVEFVERLVGADQSDPAVSVPVPAVSSVLALPSGAAPESSGCGVPAQPQLPHQPDQFAWLMQMMQDQIAMQQQFAQQQFVLQQQFAPPKPKSQPVQKIQTKRRVLSKEEYLVQNPASESVVDHVPVLKKKTGVELIKEREEMHNIRLDQETIKSEMAKDATLIKTIPRLERHLKKSLEKQIEFAGKREHWAWALATYDEIRASAGMEPDEDQPVVKRPKISPEMKRKADAFVAGEETPSEHEPSAGEESSGEDEVAG